MDCPDIDVGMALIYYDGMTFAAITRSGRGIGVPDDKAPYHFLPANISNRELGEAAIDCLNASRALTEEEKKHFFFREALNARDKWLEELLVEGMQATSYNKLKKQLMLIDVIKVGNLSDSAYADQIKPEPGQNMALKPTLNKNGKSWGHLLDYYGTRINTTYPMDPSELGKLIREAFMRCDGKGREKIEFPEPLPD